MKAPIFNNDWAIFSKMFCNYGACQGFGSVINLKTDDPNLPMSQDELSDEPALKKKNKAAVRKNQLAINALFTAFRKDPSLLQLVLNTSTEKWPNGRAWIAMRKIEMKFNPQDNVTMLDAEKAMEEVKMQADESPSEFYDRLLSIQRLYPRQLTDDALRNAMMRKCHVQYRDIVIQSLRKADLTAEELTEDMQHVFRTMKSLNFDSIPRQDESEAVLMQQTPPSSL